MWHILVASGREGDRVGSVVSRGWTASTLMFVPNKPCRLGLVGACVRCRWLGGGMSSIVSFGRYWVFWLVTRCPCGSYMPSVALARFLSSTPCDDHSPCLAGNRPGGGVWFASPLPWRLMIKLRGRSHGLHQSACPAPGRIKCM